MLKLKTIGLIVIGVYFYQPAFSQEELEREKQFHAKNSVSVEIGHAHLTGGFKNGEPHWLTVPSWSINYNRMLNQRWKLGLHTDIIIEEFKVVRKGTSSSSEEESIERSYPISFVGAASYELLPWLWLITGAGAEYAPEKTFTLFRIGLEPGIELYPKWEMVFSLVYDIKIDAYNHWNLGMGVAREF